MDNIFIRNVLIIMILVMVIYTVLAYIYSLFLNQNITLATPVVSKLGDVIDDASDTTTNFLKNILDIINGTIHMIGNLLNGLSTPYPIETTANNTTPISTPSSKKENMANLDEKINNSRFTSTTPEPHTEEKTKWCFIGNHNGKDTCVEIKDNKECASISFDKKEICESKEKRESEFLGAKYLNKRKI